MKLKSSIFGRNILKNRIQSSHAPSSHAVVVPLDIKKGQYLKDEIDQPDARMTSTGNFPFLTSSVVDDFNHYSDMDGYSRNEGGRQLGERETSLVVKMVAVCLTTIANRYDIKVAKDLLFALTHEEFSIEELRRTVTSVQDCEKVTQEIVDQCVAQTKPE